MDSHITDAWRRVEAPAAMLCAPVPARFQGYVAVAPAPWLKQALVLGSAEAQLLKGNVIAHRFESDEDGEIEWGVGEVKEVLINKKDTVEVEDDSGFTCCYPKNFSVYYDCDEETVLHYLDLDM